MIKLFEEFSRRDYDSIKSKVFDIFEIEANDSEIEEFELSDKFTEDMSDNDYVKELVNFILNK